MDKKATVSVIVPIYKVENYLRQCLDSLVAQTYCDLEIILIDDGSPDNCGAICDEYAARDSRFRVIHKENAGLSAAWNDGMRASTGEWITFVDSDDWIEPDYLAEMMNDPYLNEVDVVQTSGFYCEEGSRQYVQRMFLSRFYYKSGEGRESLVAHTLIRPGDKRAKAKIAGAWGKLYRTAFLKKGGYLFDEKIRAGLANDILFNVEVFLGGASISGILYYGYHYRKSENSGTFRYDPKRPQAQSYVFEQLEKKISKPLASDNMIKALESYCLRDIVQNLTRTFFHPENKGSQRETADGIKEMKHISCYHKAIFSKNNPYNDVRLQAFQLALRLPWIWPLKMMVDIWDTVDRREKT